MLGEEISYLAVANQMFIRAQKMVPSLIIRKTTLEFKNVFQNVFVAPIYSFYKATLSSKHNSLVVLKINTF